MSDVSMVKSNKPYRVAIDRRWQLDDLTVFSKAYEETYFALFGLFSVLELTDAKAPYSVGRSSRAFRSYPWTGGYSAVHFFRELKNSVPKSERPTITRIQYASPGIIELVLAQHVAVQIGALVASICGSIKLINSTYNGIYKGYTDRQLAKISVQRAQIELTKDQIDFIAHSNQQLGQALGVKDITKIDSATGHPLRTLKILLAIFRRVMKLSKMQSDGKLTLPKE